MHLVLESGEQQKIDAFRKLEGANDVALPAVIHDIYPQENRVLCLPHDRPNEASRIVSIDLVTGKKVEFVIQNDRPRTFGRYCSGSFSPDGQYVLMQFNYGPDDHYEGGYLQLFTKEGKFVEELSQPLVNVGSPALNHVWLSTNWVVYTNQKETIFAKFNE